ncbi:MAG: VanW family protein [Candidatus Saccharimonadales bacterium]
MDDSFDTTDSAPSWKRSPLWVRILGGFVLATLLLVGSFELVYAGRIYPGVSADGVSLAGAPKASAARQIRSKTSDFAGQVVTISDGQADLHIPVASLSASYDADKAAELAFQYGRQGSLVDRLQQQLRALLGRPTNFAAYSYDDARLAPYVVDLADDILTPAVDASLSFDGGSPVVTPAQSGARLDYGRLEQLVSDRLSKTSSDPIPAPVYSLDPALSTASLKAVTAKLGSYLAGPITLNYSGTSKVIDQKTIISWVQVGAQASQKSVLQTQDLKTFYPAAPSASLGLSKAAIEKYVAGLAADLDRTARNATLTMTGGQLAVSTPSRTGVKLDQADAVQSVEASLKRSGNDRNIDLKLAVTQADVNESNLDSLGIKEQISEGETYFPGSPSTRLTNVRAGANRFNGVLLKPGETFSFGALLGDVGPETGYVPELVILGDHEEKQYGGGLCQVSSTAFRAALAAGLPITERVNHAFAISYYTWPYNAPGVDATIYYPAVDFKFVNDTGHYILMQTVMSGVDLKFDFFGTKTKTGVVRGPDFVTGSADPTVPSHTVFYRDVLDLAGKVTKTDKFDTWYKSSKDFPITKQFN